MILVQYDPEADVLYFKLRAIRPGEDRGARQLDERRFVHYDANDEPIAVEILDASDGFELEGLPEAEEIGRSFQTLHRLPAPA